jgi:hypothetical protein
VELGERLGNLQAQYDRHVVAMQARPPPIPHAPLHDTPPPRASLKTVMLGTWMARVESSRGAGPSRGAGGMCLKRPGGGGGQATGPFKAPLTH